MICNCADKSDKEENKVKRHLTVQSIRLATASTQRVALLIDDNTVNMLAKKLKRY